jgi:hypothetical protein
MYIICEHTSLLQRLLPGQYLPFPNSDDQKQITICIIYNNSSFKISSVGK